MTSSTGDGTFYNKVAEKFGGYMSTVADRVYEYFPYIDAEESFEQIVKDEARTDAVALDIGCADGHNMLKLAPLFGRIVGIDFSEGMLTSALRNQAEQGVENVSFELLDAADTGLPDASFDLIYSRRGPTCYAETARLLKPGGVYVEIQIGELDARELKEIFGCGQDFGLWCESALQKNAQQLTAAGLQVFRGQECFQNDIFLNADHLSLFLERVPIFTDYDPEADRPCLEAYVAGHTRPEGVLLPRHRIVLAARKL